MMDRGHMLSFEPCGMGVINQGEKTPQIQNVDINPGGER